MDREPVNSEETQELIVRAGRGDESAMATLLTKHQDSLHRLVGLRLDHRLQGRVDASDVVQEAMIEAAGRLQEYVDKPPMSFYLWLRWLTVDKLLMAHRHHLGAQKRDARHEVSIYRRPMPEASSIMLAQRLLGQMTSPTQAVARAEMQIEVLP